MIFIFIGIKIEIKPKTNRFLTKYNLLIVKRIAINYNIYIICKIIYYI